MDSGRSNKMTPSCKWSIGETDLVKSVMVVYPISLDNCPGAYLRLRLKGRGALIGRKALNQGGHLSSFPFKEV